VSSKERVLNEAQTADRLGVSPSTLRNWRHRNFGPVFRRFGRTIRYLTSDVDAYIAANAGGPAVTAVKTKR
jgi:predicted DNA-binding transcriptional regulator AlpA